MIIFVYTQLHIINCIFVASKATRSLNFLCHCLFRCLTVVKSIAYKCVARTTMEYACSIGILIQLRTLTF